MTVWPAPSVLATLRKVVQQGELRVTPCGETYNNIRGLARRRWVKHRPDSQIYRPTKAGTTALRLFDKIEREKAEAPACENPVRRSKCNEPSAATVQVLQQVAATGAQGLAVPDWNAPGAPRRVLLVGLETRRWIYHAHGESIYRVTELGKAVLRQLAREEQAIAALVR